MIFYFLIFIELYLFLEIHIEYVLEKYKALNVAIKKKEKYILAMLYSAPMERSAHYINLANVNWENEIKKNKPK